MKVYRNGAEITGLFLTAAQFGQWSFEQFAMDAQIGGGTITLPGSIPWIAGDRITVTSDSGGDGEKLIHMGFVGRRGLRKPSEKFTVESWASLMDSNRQLIGRKVVDWQPGPGPVHAEIAAFVSTYLADLTVDTSNLDTSDPVEMDGPNITGDGITDLAALAIANTGWTVYILPTVDGEYEFHWHALDDGPSAGLSISDASGAADGVTVFAPRNDIETTFDPSDLYDRVEVRNGTSTVPGGSSDTYRAGGIHWEAVLSSGGTQDQITLYANSLLNGSVEKDTTTVSIGPLTAAQVAMIPAGSLIDVATDVLTGTRRISLRTLTVTHDTAGNPVPDLFDASLELGFPFRLPVSVRGTGTAGGYSGGLEDPFARYDHTHVNLQFVPIAGFPVGDVATVTAQLHDKDHKPIPLADVTITLTLEMWQDAAFTVTGDGWSLDPTSDDTDDTGTITSTLTRDSEGTAAYVYIDGSI